MELGSVGYVYVEHAAPANAGPAWKSLPGAILGQASATQQQRESLCTPPPLPGEIEYFLQFQGTYTSYAIHILGQTG